MIAHSLEHVIVGVPETLCASCAHEAHSSRTLRAPTECGRHNACVRVSPLLIRLLSLVIFATDSGGSLCSFFGLIWWEGALLVLARFRPVHPWAFTTRLQVGSRSVSTVGMLVHSLEPVIVGTSAVGLGCTHDSGFLLQHNVALQSHMSSITSHHVTLNSVFQQLYPLI